MTFFKSRKTLFALPLCLAAGVFCAYLTDLGNWSKIASGLIAFLGFLSAAVLQVMPLTVNFLQGEVLKPAQINVLAPRLERQQAYWAGLFIATMSSALLVILVSALPESFGSVTVDLWLGYYLVPSKWLIGLLGTTLAFVFYKAFGIFSGLSSLSKARRQILVQRANERALYDTEIAMRDFDSSIKSQPPDYGSILVAPKSY